MDEPRISAGARPVNDVIHGYSIHQSRLLTLANCEQVRCSSFRNGHSKHTQHPQQKLNLATTTTTTNGIVNNGISTCLAFALLSTVPYPKHTMEDEMYDDDVDLIEQVSDDEEEDDEDMDTEQQQAPPPQQQQQQQQQQQRQRGSRLTDQVNMDDEPLLAGYER